MWCRTQSDFADRELTRDAFLGGAITACQPRVGFRSGSDSVLLAAFVQARSGQSVLDLGMGAGVVALCLARRVADLEIAGLELQPAYARLACRNAGENGFEFKVEVGDVLCPPPPIAQRSFDHVVMNPPYFRERDGLAAHDSGRETANRECQTLETWIDCAIRRLKPGGRLWMMQRTSRLPEILTAVAGRCGSTMAVPLQPKAGTDSQRILLSTRKGGRGEFRLASPLVLHEEHLDCHGKRGFMPRIENVLRSPRELGI